MHGRTDEQTQRQEKLCSKLVYLLPKQEGIEAKTSSMRFTGFPVRSRHQGFAADTKSFVVSAAPTRKMRDGQGSATSFFFFGGGDGRRPSFKVAEVQEKAVEVP
eukprot:gnl/TRDRNA2_/TRDRNA2_153595_c0_seq1.p1 gnl/TRDRNA2_/TRDRNA2_153595_c0~~gnl/TRDRNA2_/TRDRNA2_153595_c0_seq1.p1  ORF type:complete len:104 (+),score=10.00 gnl/TRDRNA2_/TRDRNA2_153595_c0_seq1:340-651(+)